VLIATTLAELRALPPVAKPQPVSVPTPPGPPQPPQPEPVHMRLPDAAQNIVVALYQQNINLANGDDDQRRRLTSKIAETVRFTLGPSWGWKSAGSGRPPSKDAIAVMQGASLLGFDLFNGGTREPNDHPESEDITGQQFIAVPPVNHLADTAPGPTPTPTPAPTGVTRAELETAISDAKQALRVEFEVELGAITDRIDALDARLTALPAAQPFDPALYEVEGRSGQTFGHSHSARLQLRRKA
jgi:hypothetical protein